MTRDPRVVLTVIGPKDEYNVAIIKERVNEITLEGVEEQEGGLSPPGCPLPIRKNCGSQPW